MEIRKVDSDFAVAPQLQPEDMERVAKEGYRTIICNRPDGEEHDQADAQSMCRAAEAVGLTFHHIPVTSGQLTSAAIAEFRAVRVSATGPTLAYCRTGTRCMTLEVLANPEDQDPDTRLRRAVSAGYDLTALRDQL